MNYKYKLLEWVIILLATFIISYVLSIDSVRAENRVDMRTLDSEIIRLVKQYGISKKNETVIRKIISCESQNNYLAINKNKDADGIVWSTDRGYFQVNDYYHKDTMENLGLDINDRWDNLEYGFLLISKYGFSPWKSSQKCWAKSIDK